MTPALLKEADLTALVSALQSFVDWAEQHRAAAKAAGERPAIDAARVRTAKAALARIR